MTQEIERQFVVDTENLDWKKLRETLPKVYITQSTIHRGEGNKLRVRLIDDPKSGKKSAAFTFKVKKKSRKTEPNIRDEYEWEVPYRVALFIMIGHGEVTKTRYMYKQTD
jgi:CYTH domain-containing protein